MNPTLSPQEALEAFLAEHRYRGSSPATERYYSELICRFQREARIADLAEISHMRVIAWFGAKRGAVRPKSLETYDRGLRIYFRWLHRRGLIERDPMAGEPKPRAPKTKIVPFTQEEVKALLAEAKRPPNPLRKTAAYLTLLDTGIRAGELLNLRLCDIDWRGGVINVSGKTGERTVPVSEPARRALRAYIERERKANTPSLEERVFLAKRKPIAVSQFSRDTVRMARRLGFERNHVGPHTLRHTFAVEYLRAGGDLATLQMILGHTRLEMTLVYVNFVKTDLAERHARFSPLARLRLGGGL